jgi:DNA-binding transcriptional MocR family regulator
MPIQAVDDRRLYRQIADQLTMLITSGEFRRGERLPSERDLAVQLGVSRPSVRDARKARTAMRAHIRRVSADFATDGRRPRHNRRRPPRRSAAASVPFEPPAPEDNARPRARGAGGWPCGVTEPPRTVVGRHELAQFPAAAARIRPYSTKRGGNGPPERPASSKVNRRRKLLLVPWNG